MGKYHVNAKNLNRKPDEKKIWRLKIFYMNFNVVGRIS